MMTSTMDRCLAAVAKSLDSLSPMCRATGPARALRRVAATEARPTPAPANRAGAVGQVSRPAATRFWPREPAQAGFVALLLRLEPPGPTLQSPYRCFAPT